MVIEANIRATNGIYEIAADPYDILTEILKYYGISMCAGVTGGGIIHFTRKMLPHSKSRPGGESLDDLYLFTIGEYSAGFVPLGYYLAGRS